MSVAIVSVSSGHSLLKCIDCGEMTSTIVHTKGRFGEITFPLRRNPQDNEIQISGAGGGEFKKKRLGGSWEQNGKSRERSHREEATVYGHYLLMA